MRRLFLRGFQLFLIFVLLGIPGFMSFSEGFQTERDQALFEKGLYNLGVEKLTKSNEMLQFMAGGHVLGFLEGEVFIASGDHALRVEFINARSVSPEDEFISPANRMVSPLNDRDFVDAMEYRQAKRPLEKVIYKELWEGVTLVYEKHSSGVVKSTYTVLPSGTNDTSPIDRIRLRYNVPVEVDEGGNLVFSFETGQMTESSPVAWQEIKGKQIPVDVSFRSINKQEVGFKAGSYNPHYPLVIDPVLSWNTFMGSTSTDVGWSIAVDGSGNVYVAGWSDAAWGSPLNPHAGGKDAFAAKLSSNGVRQWHTFMGSTADDDGTSIAVDGSGNVYVEGWSDAAWGTPVSAHAGSKDVFAVKLSSNGKLYWHTFMGSPDWDMGRSIAVDGSGNVYVAGSSNVNWGWPVNAHSGMADAFAVKLNSNGVRQWHTFMGSINNDYGEAIDVDGSGNVYVAGTSTAMTWGAPVNPHAGQDDAFAAKLNSSGVRQWNTFMGSSLHDRCNGIAVDGNGNVCVTGHSYATWGTPVNVFRGSRDAFVASLDGDGKRLWHTFMGSKSQDFARSITVDGSGNVYVAGVSTATWGSPVNAYVGGYDAFVAKLNSSGVRQWNAFMGSAGVDYAYGIAVDGSGDVYVTGFSDATWGTPVNAHEGDYDAIAVKITAPRDKEDILGTWSSGVWYRDSETDSWIKISTTADPIAAGDLDGDDIADLVGVWIGGLWVKYSSTGGWKRLSSPPLPTAIACGDFNGDGRDDVVGSWPSGTFYRDTLGWSWVYVSSPADVLAAGDLDGDGTDDIIGVWTSGLWVNYSFSGAWSRLSTPLPTDIAAGDMNGDGRDDVLGTWSSGTFYWDTLGWSWVYVSTPADLVALGDLDGDGTDDMIGTWSGTYVGLWVKYSATMSWKKISLSLPSDLDAGLYRGGTWDVRKTK